MARVERPLVVALLIALLADVASAQREAWRIEGRFHTERFGDAVALLPDRTGDGVPELLVGAPPPFGSNASCDRGGVRVLSGSDLAVLLEIGGQPFRERKNGERDGFGSSVAAAGDADGDGVADFLVGNTNRAVVELLSGADGHLLASYAGAAASFFGSSLADLGDVDGDGRNDFAVGAPEERGASNRRGVVTVFSGATGAVLHRRETLADRTGMGSRDRIAALSDLDGDGAHDLGVVDVQRVGSVTTSLVRVRSGRSGSVLLDIPFDHGTLVNVSLVAIAPFGDLDQDGTLDCIVGATHNSLSKCLGYVLSGADGRVLLRVDGDGGSSWVAVGSAGDLDGDARDELIVGCDDWSGGGSRLRLFRGSDGAQLQEIVEPSDREFGRVFAGGIDFDGDGMPDVAIGIPDVRDPAVAPMYYFCGALDTWSWSAGMRLQRHLGLTEYRSIALGEWTDDVDGDGCTDVIHALFRPLGGTLHHSVQVRSGRDGSLLADHPVLGGRIQALATLPDLDGDAIGDYAVTILDGIALDGVELRSSATGATIRACVPPAYDDYFGGTLAVGVDAGGGVQLAVGSPHADPAFAGMADVFDATTGQHRFRIVGAAEYAHCGSALAFLGDVDGDGTGDWLIGAPDDATTGVYNGRATVVSGRDGATIVDLFGSRDWDAFGRAAAAIGDQDGDGVGDVAIGVPVAGPSYEGEVHLYSGRTWTPFAIVTGPAGRDSYGCIIHAPGDMNRDGIEEWTAGSFLEGPLDLRSGATGTTIARLSLRARFAPKWQLGSATGDRTHDVLDGYDVAGNEFGAGTLALFEMEELFLDVEPPTAQQGDVVVATTRGGVPTLPTALELVAWNGVAVGALIDVGGFDVIGERALNDVIPPGLAGNFLELRAWALDAHGKLVESAVASLTLE